MIRKKKNRRNEEGIKIVATNIRKYRDAKDMTIEELANKLEVDYSQISRIERCIVNPSISIIFDIAKVLEVTPSQLLNG